MKQKTKTILILRGGTWFFVFENCFHYLYIIENKFDYALYFVDEQNYIGLSWHFLRIFFISIFSITIISIMNNIKKIN